MADQFTTSGRSSVAGGTSIGSKYGLKIADTTLTLPTGDGSKFPASGAFNLAIGSPNDLSTTEVVQCSSRSGDVLTIVRHQENTAARNWEVGTPVTYRSTAGGAITVAVPATTVPTAPQSYHCMVYWLTAGTVTVIAIGATTIAAAAVAGQCFFVPAGQTVTLTFSGAPTWQWFIVE